MSSKVEVKSSELYLSCVCSEGLNSFDVSLQYKSEGHSPNKMNPCADVLQKIRIKFMKPSVSFILSLG